MYIYTYLHTCIHYIYACIHTYFHVCIHYIYASIHTHTYTYMHTYTHTCIRLRPVWQLEVKRKLIGLIHTASQAEPNRTDLAWKTNVRYEMEAFILHAEPSRTEPDRA